MLGDIPWLSLIKTKKKQKEEDDKYLAWAFPHGAAQKEKIVAILHELVPAEAEAAALISFLTAKELYDDAYGSEDDHDNAVKVMKTWLRKHHGMVKPADAPYYMALAIADHGIGSNLNYPSVEKIREMAQEEFM